MPYTLHVPFSLDREARKSWPHRNHTHRRVPSVHDSDLQTLLRVEHLTGLSYEQQTRMADMAVVSCVRTAMPHGSGNLTRASRGTFHAQACRILGCTHSNKTLAEYRGHPGLGLNCEVVGMRIQ